MSRGPQPPGWSLLLDIQATQSREYGERGVARHVAELARELIAIPGLVRGLLINPVLPFPGHLHPDLYCSPLLRWNTATELRRLLDAPGQVAYHLMSPTELGPPVASVLPAHVLEAGLPRVLTLYDIVPLLEPEVYLNQPQKRERYLVRMELYRSADLVLTLSESVRRDAVRILDLDPRRVVVVGAGAGRFFQPAQPAQPGDDPLARLRQSLPAITGGFVLNVTATDARKNTERLIEAYARLGSGLRQLYQLVIACRLDTAAAARWGALGESLGLDPGELVLTGQVTDDTLRDLYRGAALMVFPSLHEGFGLPVAEAIACGCPVITSDASAVPEVLDDPRTTFDARDADAISEAMRQALESPRRLGVLRDTARRRASWWTWESVAEREAGALRLLEGGRSVAAVRDPLRIALVWALPTQGSPGVEAVAAPLARRCRLDVYTAGLRPPAGWLPRGSSRLPLEGLERSGAAATYDAVIYAVAGSAVDQPVLAAARRHPGILWLVGESAADLYRQDARTPAAAPALGPGWHRNEGAQASPAENLALAVRTQYADRAPAPILDDLDAGGEMSPALERRYGVLLLGEMVRGARAVAVVDEATAHRVHLDAGPEGLPRTIHALPTAAGPAAVADALLALAASLRGVQVAEARHQPPLPRAS